METFLELQTIHTCQLRVKSWYNVFGFLSCTMPKIIYGTYENYHNDQSAVESVCHRVFSKVSISSSWFQLVFQTHKLCLF